MKPAIQNVLNYVSPYPLDYVHPDEIALALSMRRLKTGKMLGLRIRDDTNTEQDIGFIGENLDTSGMLAWLQRDLISDIPLGVDLSPADGVSDGWAIYNGTGITSSYEITDGKQKQEITASTSTSIAQLYTSESYSCIYNSTNITITAYVQTFGDVQAKLGFQFNTSGGSYVSASLKSQASYSSRTLVTYNVTVPNNATIAKVIPLLQIVPTVSGNTGYAIWEDASVTISNQSAYVAKWYDQSGNGNDAVQTTAANQPRIVNSGVVDVDSAGRPTLVFDGTNDCLRIADDATLQLTTQLSINSVSKCDSTGGGYILCRNGSSAAEIQYASHTSANKNIYLEGAIRDANTTTISTEYIRTDIWSGASAEIFSNGSSNGSSAYAVTPLTNRTNTFVGCRSGAADGSTQSFNFNGNISEITLFNVALSESQRQKLENNQNRYYSVF